MNTVIVFVTAKQCLMFVIAKHISAADSGSCTKPPDPQPRQHQAPRSRPCSNPLIYEG